MGLRASKKAETRQDILETAERRFRRDGFEGTSIRSIAADARVSVQTLYNYFPSKEGLLAALAADRFQAMAGGAEQVRVDFLEADDAEGTPVERFLQLVRWGLRAMSKDREFMSLVFLNARDVLYGPPLASRSDETAVSDDLRARQIENEQVLERMFLGMQKAGAIREDIPAREVADLYMMIFSARVASWLERADSTLDELEASVIGGLEIIFRGVAPD